MNKEKLHLLAGKLMFSMKEEEYDTLSKEFDTILRQMDLIGKIENIESVEPMFYPFELEDVPLRVDEISDKLSSEDILKNASSTYSDMIKVPKVVD